MAELGNLWFRLGLDNREFEKTWKATLDKYSKEAKINIQASIQAANAASKGVSPYMQQKNAIKLQEFARREAAKTAQQEAISQSKIKAEIAKTAIQQEKLNNARKKGVNSVSLINGKLRAQTRLVSGLNHLAGTYMSIFAGAAVLRNIIRISGEFEMQKVSLRAMLKDAAGADAIYAKTQNLALKSPFQFKELITYTKQLAAFSIPKDELYDTMKMLTDVSAGLGVGMDRITLVYGQIKTAAFLRGQEVRQITEAGIPILEELAKQFSEVEGRAVSAGQVFDKISARLVPFEMVNKVFKDLTSEGGKFYKMQEIQAETLKGKVSNLTDAYQKMYAEIGEKGDSVFKGGVDLVRNMIDNYEKIGSIILNVAAAYGSYRTAILLTNAAHILVKKGILSLTITEAAHYGLLVTLEKAQSLLNKTMLKNPYVLLGTALGVLSYGFYKAMTAETAFTESQNRLNKAFGGVEKSVISEINTLDDLNKKLRESAKGSKEYNEAKEEIVNNYGKYFNGLDAEIERVGDLSSAYDVLIDKIRLSYGERQFESFSQKENERLDKVMTEQFDDIYQKLIDKYGKEEGLDIYSQVFKYATTGGELEKKYWDALASVDYVKWGFEDSPVGIAVKSLKNNLLELLKEKAQSDAIIREYKERFGIENTEGGKDEAADYIPQGTEKRIRELFAKRGITEENKGKAGTYWYDQFTERYEYIDNLRKRYAEIPQLIKDAGDAEADLVPPLREEAGLVEEIAKTLDVSLEEEKKRGGDSDWNKLKISSIEREANEIIKIANSYDKLREANDELGESSRKTDEDLKRELATIYGVKESMELSSEYIETLKNLEAIGGVPELKAYPGTGGVWTIGYGHTKDVKPGDVITKEEAEALLMQDIESHSGVLKDLIQSGAKFTQGQYEALFDIAYNSGPGNLRKLWKMYGGDLDSIGIAYKDYKLKDRKGNELSHLKKRRALMSDVFHQKNGADITDGLIDTNFEEQINGLITKLRTLGEEGVIAANKIKEKFSSFVDKNNFDKLIESYNIQKELDKIVNDLLSQDFNIQGKGIGFDVSKIASDLQNSYAKINKEEQDAIELLGKSETAQNEIVYNSELLFIRSLYQKKRDAEKSIANEKLRDLAGKYISEIQGLDMTDFGNKTIGQINKLISRLNTAKNNIEIGDAIKAQAEKAGLSLEGLKGIIEELLGIKIDDATTEKLKKIEDVTKDVTSSVGELGSEMASLGQNTGTLWLRGLGTGLGYLQELSDIFLSQDGFIEAISDSFKDVGKKVGEGIGDAVDNLGEAGKDLIDTSSLVSLIFSIITFAFKMFSIQMQAETQNMINALQAGADYFKQSLQEALGANDTIFGSNDLEKFMLNITNAEDALKRLNAFKEEATSDKRGFGNFWTYGIGKYTLEDNMNMHGFTLYAKDGKLNLEQLKSYYEKYKDDMSESSRALVKQMIANGEIYNEAMEAQADYLEGLFGQVADNIAEVMINSFEKTGSVVTDLGDITKDIVRGMIKDLLKAVFILPRFKELKGEAMAIYGDENMSLEDKTKAVTKLINDAINGIENDADAANQILQNFNEYFQDGSTNDSNMINGSLTEETGSLISSYINAIRADVSFNRISVSEINVEVKSINANIVNGISILTAIRENTFRSANGVDIIKDFLNSARGEQGSIRVDLINT